MEERDCPWWQHGHLNWINEQSKRRLRVNRDTLNFILNAIEEDDVQMPLKLVKELLKGQMNQNFDIFYFRLILVKCV